MFFGLKSPRTSVRSVGGLIHGGDQGIDARGYVWMCTRGGAVVRVDSQLLKQARVGQSFAQGGMFRGPGVNRAQDRTQPRGDFRVRSGQPSSGSSTSLRRQGRMSSQKGTRGRSSNKTVGTVPSGRIE